MSELSGKKPKNNFGLAAMATELDALNRAELAERARELDRTFREMAYGLNQTFSTIAASQASVLRTLAPQGNIMAERFNLALTEVEDGPEVLLALALANREERSALRDCIGQLLKMLDNGNAIVTGRSVEEWKYDNLVIPGETPTLQLTVLGEEFILNHRDILAIEDMWNDNRVGKKYKKMIHEDALFSEVWKGIVELLYRVTPYVFNEERKLVERRRLRYSKEISKDAKVVVDKTEGREEEDLSLPDYMSGSDYEMFVLCESFRNEIKNRWRKDKARNVLRIFDYAVDIGTLENAHKDMTDMPRATFYECKRDLVDAFRDFISERREAQ